MQSAVGLQLSVPVMQLAILGAKADMLKMLFIAMDGKEGDFTYRTGVKPVNAIGAEQFRCDT